MDEQKVLVITIRSDLFHFVVAVVVVLADAAAEIAMFLVRTHFINHKLNQELSFDRRPKHKLLYSKYTAICAMNIAINPIFFILVFQFSADCNLKALTFTTESLSIETDLSA